MEQTRVRMDAEAELAVVEVGHKERNEAGIGQAVVHTASGCVRQRQHR